MAVNEERLVRTFVDLVQVDSPSSREGNFAAHLEKVLLEMGLETKRDDSADKTGSDTGNVIAYVPRSGECDAPVFLSAHMDTVESNAGVAPVVADGWIRTDGRTILGADDKAGIACALEAVRTIMENGTAHGGIVLIFTVGEETGLYGARHLDLGQIPARRGFVLDGEGAVGSVTVRTPADTEFTARITGRAAHAGVEPEKGVNAITVAAKAIAALPWGRLDHQTTTNVGLIQGGQATNSVPERAEVRGEIRARDKRRLESLTRDIVSAFETAAKDAGAEAQVDLWEGFPLLDVDERSELARMTIRAAERIGVEHSFVDSGGGSDANVFYARGLACVNLGLGMCAAHTAKERVRITDLVKATEYLIALVEECRGGN